VKPLDSLDAVEAVMALEEELEGPLPKRMPELKPFLVQPFVVQCIKGGFSIEVWVFARYRNTVLFASFEGRQYGVGSLNGNGEVHESFHYPTLPMAARAFLGAIKEAA
jgi:hypothetical protein